MPQNIEELTNAIKHHWWGTPSDKAKQYVKQFFNKRRIGKKIVAEVKGNHGTYSVSIEASEQGLSSACSCYIGKGGFCHHCHALATTFLNNPTAFTEIKSKELYEVQHLSELEEYLQHITLDALLKDLRAKGITQKDFAQAIGMNPRHLTSIKSSESRNRYYNELGATKLACLWVLEHFKDKGVAAKMTRSTKT